MKRIVQLWMTIALIISVSLGHTANIKKIEHGLSDTFITTVITAKYTKSSQLNPLKVYVTTKSGVVYLSGHVKNNASFAEALRLAKNTNGVKAVNVDDLVILPTNTVLTDAYITTKVEAAILKAKIIDDEAIPLVGINVKTSNGVVTLKGILNSEKSMIILTKRVSQVRGVKRVISKLLLKPQE